MATSNPIVSSLTAYVEEKNGELLAKSVAGAKSAKLFNLQTGCKGKTAINLTDMTVVFGDGSVCGWNESGTTEFTQRTIDAIPLSVNMAFCDKKLLKTWANYQVQVAALPEDKKMPFEQNFINMLVDRIDAGIEKMIYQGVSGQTDEFEGLISILSGATTTANTVSAASGVSAYSFLKDVAKKLKPVVYEKGNVAILVSKALYEEYMQDLVSANLYHYNPGDGEDEYRLPGTSVKVIAVNGLNDTATNDYAIAGNLSNFYYGCDLEGDEDKIEGWYSKDNREFRFASEFVAGVQVAFPDEVVFGKRAKA